MNMCRGKYQRVNSKKRNMGKPIMLIVSLLLLVAAVGGTVAFLRATSGQVTNTFTPGEVKVKINEKTTSTTKYDISFTNPDKDQDNQPLDTVPVYIRATLVIYWTDALDLADNGADNPTQQIIPKPSGASVMVGTNSETAVDISEAVPKANSGWFKVGDIYYYSAPVAPGSSTTVMLDPITVTLPEGSTAQCHIDVHAEAIQAEPETVVAAAWKDVEIYVDADGNKLLKAK